MRLVTVGIVTKNRDARGKAFSGGLGGTGNRRDGLVAGDATRSLSAFVSSHLVLKFDAELVSS